MTRSLRSALWAFAACALVTLAPATTFAQEDPFEDARLREMLELSQKAIDELTNKQFDTSIETYQQLLTLLEANPWIPEELAESQRQIAHYNIACAYSLKGDTEPAIEHFRISVDLGFTDADHIKKDTDLDNIRGDPRFKEILSGIEDPLAGKKRQILRALAATPPGAFPFDFDLETIDGKRIKLKDLAGKVVLVDFWGTWCPPCRRAIPHLKALYKKHKANGLEIVGLNFERVPAERALETVKKFVDDHGIEYPCALVPREVIDSVPDFEGFPTMLMIDREGRVRLKKVGFEEGEVLEAAILRLLDEKSDAPAPKADEAPAAPKAPKKGEPQVF